MKRGLCFILAILIILFCHSASYGFSSGSTGSLGALNPTASIEITLPGDGILNYTTVNIPTGVTVTFKTNAANTPVYMLATGNVTIAGTINVSGSAAGTNASGAIPGKGGPGGFDGGFGGFPMMGGIPATPGGKGQGPGGGNPGSPSNNVSAFTGGGGGGGGSFTTIGGTGTGNAAYAPGGTGGEVYGNFKILPMTGGSGGGGSAGLSSGSLISGSGGGGGGGAILIASSETISVTGAIKADGGAGGLVGASGGGGGSGGSVKLMAKTISGAVTTSITASGESFYSVTYSGGIGGTGRIRFEANTVTFVFSTTPAYTYGYPSTVFVTNMPALKITAVGGVNVPANPSGRYGTPDVSLPTSITNPVTINITATNIPVGTQVKLTSVPEYGTSASAAGTLSGSNTSSAASVSVSLSRSYQNILYASATFTVQTTMFYDGEKIDKVRVAAVMGGESEAVYITESGKEIKAAELMAYLTE